MKIKKNMNTKLKTTKTDVIKTIKTDAFAKIPDTISILHRDYEIIERSVSQINTGYGEIDYINGTIHYVALSGSETVDTIIHEALHGLWRSFHLPPEDEEHIVSTLATGLTTIMRDNPTLFPVLQDLVEEQ